MSALSNYRPVSIVPLFGKVLEAMINTELDKLLIFQGFLSDKQYDFCFTMSTLDVLTIIAESVLHALNMNSEAQAIALHILKVVDRVWRTNHLHKVKGYGISVKIS